MKITELFDEDAVREVSEKLTEKCVEGARLTRAELCQELGLTEALPGTATKDQKLHNLAVEAVVGSLINLGVIPGFSAKKGPGGGIGVIGTEAPVTDKKAKKARRHIEYPEGFLTNLRDTLDRLCIGTKKISRKEIIQATALPEGMDAFDAMNMLSAAKAQGDLPGFDSARGVGGGFFRAPIVATPAPATVEAPAASAETAEAAAPAEGEAQASAETVAEAPAQEEVQAEAAPAEIAQETPAASEESAPEETAPKAKATANRKRSARK
jgi:hypothetical protein